MSTDLTFFTNESDQTILDRFRVNIERQIDKMVYELYGPTPEEIAVVEGKKE
ncbi:MAG: hypothetical protein WA162_08675 [Thermodesulfobacteriota bacterium]